MKQLPAILLALICAALAVSLISEKRENAALKAERAAFEIAWTEKAGAEVIPPPIEEVNAPVAAAEAEAPTNEVDAAVVENTLENHQRVMNSMAKMRDNPTMNKIIEASQRGTIGALYADMIEYLNLSPDETNHFMDLLMYRQMEQVDFGMKLMSGAMSDEEKQAAADHLGEIDDDMKEQMKAFLNSERDYEEFEFYEKTIGERMALSQMDQTLAAADQPLTDVEYRALLGMMQDEKTAFDWSTDLHDQESADISAERFSRENMRKHSEDVARLNESIFEKAMSLLTPEQFEAFKASIQATTDMQMAQFEMAGQLLRGGE